MSSSALPHDRALPGDLTARDWESSATVRDFTKLDRALRHVERSAGAEFETLVDMGCGYGGLTTYIAQRFSISEAHGLDLDEERLELARERGVQVHRLDLEHDAYPLGDATADMALSFGAFEHFVWYDHVLSEAARMLRDGGYLIISKPNLGSYINRVALLLGYQPRDVEVSTEILAGALPQYRSGPLHHVHSSTLRAMRELLDHHGFVVERTDGFSPDFGSRVVNLLDRLFGRFPAISRRFIIVARRRPR